MMSMLRQSKIFSSLLQFLHHHHPYVCAVVPIHPYFINDVKHAMLMRRQFEACRLGNNWMMNEGSKRLSSHLLLILVALCRCAGVWLWLNALYIRNAFDRSRTLAQWNLPIITSEVATATQLLKLMCCWCNYAYRPLYNSVRADMLFRARLKSIYYIYLVKKFF